MKALFTITVTLLLALPATAQVIVTAPPEQFVGPYRLNEAALSQPGDIFFGRRLTQGGQRLFASGDGAVYAYSRSGSQWTQGLSLVVNTPGFGRFLDSDGTRLIVGAQGSAYIFEQQGGPDWILTATLQPEPAASGFGGVVGISGDRAIVTGAPGGLMVYHLVGGTWSAEQQLPVLGAAGISGSVIAVGSNVNQLAIYELGGDGVWTRSTTLSQFDPLSHDAGLDLVVETQMYGGARFWEKRPTGWTHTYTFFGNSNYGSVSIDGPVVALGGGGEAQVAARTASGWALIANFKGTYTGASVVNVQGDTLVLGDAGFVYVHAADSDADGVRDEADPCPLDPANGCVPQPQPQPDPQPQPPDPPQPGPEPAPEPPAPSPGPVTPPEPTPGPVTPPAPEPTPEPPAPRDGPPAPGPAPQPEPPTPTPEPVPTPEPGAPQMQGASAPVPPPVSTGRAVRGVQTGRVAMPK